MQYLIVDTKFSDNLLSHIKDVRGSNTERGGWLTYSENENSLQIHNMFECKNKSLDEAFEYIPAKKITILIKLLYQYYIKKRKLGQYHTHPITNVVQRSNQDIIQHDNMKEIYPDFAMMIISKREIKTYINE